ncbi:MULTISPECIES: phage protein [Enterobacteriaceae]|jgi:hypothetical protein|uniref:Phage protein n=2 Tax=Enterobacteriaceae TaxID=543 RepID=A0ABW1Q4R2_9ENTR|nr:MULTISPECIES: hypothetical protein [Phytobacter]MBS6739359.1 hypothetical protein [Enterobacteriaceae bacterium]PXW60665.1 hypothetical protein DFO55_10275 [Grimontella sp. AG753]MDU4152736.1 hypothetical protein [Enterobacteriaceae bacterium]MDU7377501.1 hypothetical protein [Enterobacteriaceae bacterium]MDV2901301.1 hypothetical protein [Phytobacter diazotrophicus]
MTKLFGRKYSLTVTSVDGEELVIVPPMQVQFQVTNMPQDQVSTATITVFGVSAKYRQLIQHYDTSEKHYGSVRLEAGYDESVGEVFSGQIQSVEVGREGVNVYLRLKCLLAIWSDATIGKTWGNKTQASEILHDVARSFYYPVEMVGDFSDLPTFNYGHTLAHSSSRDFLNKMKAAWGYEWLLDHNRVVIIRNGASRPITHQLSASNGMEGVPKWNQQDMEVDVRLNTIIQPGDRVHITSDFWTINYTGTQQKEFQALAMAHTTSGSFRVLSTSHQGDYWNNDWKTTIRCQWRST